MPIEVESDATTLEAKHVILRVTGVPVDETRLIFKGRSMANGQKLSSYGIEANSLLHMVISASDRAADAYLSLMSKPWGQSGTMSGRMMGLVSK